MNTFFTFFTNIAILYDLHCRCISVSSGNSPAMSPSSAPSDPHPLSTQQQFVQHQQQQQFHSRQVTHGSQSGQPGGQPVGQHTTNQASFQQDSVFNTMPAGSAQPFDVNTLPSNAQGNITATSSPPAYATLPNQGQGQLMQQQGQGQVLQKGQGQVLQQGQSQPLQPGPGQQIITQQHFQSHQQQHHQYSSTGPAQSGKGQNSQVNQQAFTNGGTPSGVSAQTSSGSKTSTAIQTNGDASLQFPVVQEQQQYEQQLRSSSSRQQQQGFNQSHQPQTMQSAANQQTHQQVTNQQSQSHLISQQQQQQQQQQQMNQSANQKIQPVAQSQQYSEQSSQQHFTRGDSSMRGRDETDSQMMASGSGGVHGMSGSSMSGGASGAMSGSTSGVVSGSTSGAMSGSSSAGASSSQQYSTQQFGTSRTSTDQQLRVDTSEQMLASEMGPSSAHR